MTCVHEYPDWLQFTRDEARLLSQLATVRHRQGKLATSKYAKIEKCSQDRAYRDILDLIDLGALEKDEAGGRSTSYILKVA